MARGPSRLPQILTFLSIVCLNGAASSEHPHFTSLTPVNVTDGGFVVFEARGAHLENATRVGITAARAARGDECAKEDLEVVDLSAVERNATWARFRGEFRGRFCGRVVYACLPREVVQKSEIPPGMYTKREVWYHQGEDVAMELKEDEGCEPEGK